MKQSRHISVEQFEAILRQYEGRLLRYTARILYRDIELARDVVQEAFLKLYAEAPPNVMEALSAWLFSVCRNRALDILRKESRMKPFSDEDHRSRISPEPGPEQSLEQKETLAEIMAELQSLPKAQQEVIYLKLQENLSYKEISKITGLSVSNVGVQIHTGIKSMRENLSQSNIGVHQAPGGSK